MDTNLKKRSYKEGIEQRRHSSNERDTREYEKEYFKKVNLNLPLFSFNEFIQIQPADIPIKKLERFYTIYKQDHQQRQIEIFFYEHRREEWFEEKYSPLAKAELEVHFSEQVSKSWDVFAQNYQAQKFKNLDLSVAQDIETLFTQQNQTKLNYHGVVHLREEFTITNAPVHGFDPNSLTLFLKAVPKDISRESLLDIFQKIPGFASLSLSEPLRSQDFVRYGWAAFRTEEDCAKGYLVAQPQLHSKLGLSLMKSKTAKRFLRVAPNMSLKEIAEHLVLAAKLALLLDRVQGLKCNPILAPDLMNLVRTESKQAEFNQQVKAEDNQQENIIQEAQNDETGIKIENQESNNEAIQEEESRPKAQDENIKTEDLKIEAFSEIDLVERLHNLYTEFDLVSFLRQSQISPVRLLDLLIIYLRKVHYFCYFSATQFNDERKLSAKNGCAFLRSKIDLHLLLGIRPSEGKSVLIENMINEVGLETLAKEERLLQLAGTVIDKKKAVFDWNIKIKIAIAKKIIQTEDIVK